MKTEKVTLQLDSEIKQEAEAIINNLGCDLNVAINMFLAQVIYHSGFPFDVTRSNCDSEETKE